MEKLSGLDATFLYSEESGTPMHVGGVQFYLPPDGEFDFEHMRETIRSRLLTPLTRWRRYGERSEQMRQALQQIAGLPELSRDSYEIVSKSLAA